MKRLGGALGVDPSLLGFGDMLSGGLGDGGFFRVSVLASVSSAIEREEVETQEKLAGIAGGIVQVLAAVDQDFSIADKREVMHVACRMMHVSEDDFNAMVPPPEDGQEEEQDGKGNGRKPEPDDEADDGEEAPEEGGGDAGQDEEEDTDAEADEGIEADGEDKENE